MRKCCVGTWIFTFEHLGHPSWMLHEFEAKSDQKSKWLHLIISDSWIGVEKSTYFLDSVQVIWVIEYDGLKVLIVVFPYFPFIW